MAQFTPITAIIRGIVIYAVAASNLRRSRAVDDRYTEGMQYRPQLCLQIAEEIGFVTRGNQEYNIHKPT